MLSNRMTDQEKDHAMDEVADRATTERWVCVGSVRGWCGHEHRSEENADGCRDRDQRDCAAAGGYSDRNVWSASDLPRRTDGSYYHEVCRG